MRILRFIYDWPPPWIGLAPGPYEITRTQAEMGHQMTVFCGGRLGSIPQGIPGARILMVPRALKGILLFSSAPALLIRFWIHRIFHPVDLIHGHAHITHWYNLWRLLARSKTPYFYHLHITFAGREKALLEKGYIFNPYEKVNNWAGKWCDRLGCRTANHVFAVNDSVKDEAVSLLGVDARKVTVVKNGVNASLFAPGPKDHVLLSRLDLHGDGPILLYVGVLNRRKNIGVLLRAFALLPNTFRLILAGNGPEDYLQEMRAEAANSGIVSRIRFVGYIAYPDLPAYYSLADVFVLPSLYEGMPKVLLEALASAKPSIVHSGYGLDSDLEAFVDKVDCTDPIGLADRIRASLGRGFKGEHAEFVRQFSWRFIMDKVETVYRLHLPSARADAP